MMFAKFYCLACFDEKLDDRRSQAFSDPRGQAVAVASTPVPEGQAFLEVTPVAPTNQIRQPS